MKRIIIIDDYSPELMVLMDQISGQLHMDVKVVGSVKEAREIESPSAVILSVEKSFDNYSPIEEVPTILVAGTYPIQSKQFLLASQLMDIVSDYTQHNCRYIVSLLKRIELLVDITVLVCEGEKLIQSLIARNLRILGVTPIVAESRKEVVKHLEADKSIHMALVGTHLGNISGLGILDEIRSRYNKLEFPVVVMMGENDPEETEIEFLRHGATDSIVKKLSTPLSMEQFRTRVMQTLRQVISYVELSYMAERDFLTGSYNRRHFFDAGEALFANFVRGNISFAVAMLDIDHFKNVNDSFGHPAGDMAIISIANTLEKNLRKSDLIARFGGEEFCVILTGADDEGVLTVLERIRKEVESIEHKTEQGESFHITVSIGVTVEKAKTLDDMVNRSDALLYLAKEGGRNRIVSDIEDM